MRTTALLFLAGMTGGCDGGVIQPGSDAIAGEAIVLADGTGVGLDAALDLGIGPVDAQSGADLPSKAGDPCPLGKCSGKLLCLGGQCRSECDLKKVTCNDRVSPCKANEFCGTASSFTDACYPTTAKVGSKCGKGLPLCPGGSLCVRTSTKTVCMQLCKYGCTGGKCEKTATTPVCTVCVK